MRVEYCCPRGRNRKLRQATSKRTKARSNREPPTKITCSAVGYRRFRRRNYMAVSPSLFMHSYQVCCTRVDASALGSSGPIFCCRSFRSTMCMRWLNRGILLVISVPCRSSVGCPPRLPRFSERLFCENPCIVYKI
jgi:hypothetical protein